MSKKSYLDSIKSPAPCSKDWDEMIGDKLVRFCSGCEKSVYNLSAMPRREAQKFAVRNSGKVCVRYVRLPNGKVQTADTKLYKITRQTSRIAAGVIGATLTLSAISPAQTTVSPKNETKKTVKSQNKDFSKTSQISFVIVNSVGEPIANIEVKLINQKTNEIFTTISNQKGVAFFSLLPIGNFSLEIPASFGFGEFTQKLQIKQLVESTTKIYLTAAVPVIGDFAIMNHEIPFFTAILQENNEEVQKMIFEGFNVNTKDNEKQNALHIAVENSNLNAVKILLNANIDVNAKDKQKRTPILMIDENIEEDTLEIVRLLIQKGADVNVQDKQKETALMFACFDDAFELAKLLLEAGANPNLKDEDGETALQKTDSEEIKRLLISYGAKQ